MQMIPSHPGDVHDYNVALVGFQKTSLNKT